MIEIRKRNGNWEAYVNGGLLHYSESLEGLLNYLARHGEELEEELNEPSDKNISRCGDMETASKEFYDKLNEAGESSEDVC